MSDPDSIRYDDDRLTKMGVRLLTPENTTIFEGAFNLLHCVIKDDQLYRGAYAMLMFPVGHPDHFISLHYTDTGDKDREIGIIENLNAFPEKVQNLVRGTLVKQYYEQTITRIHGIKNNFGLLFFDVETEQLGRMEFIMPWRGDRAEDFGQNGKILLDAFDNRYIIPDVSGLPLADRNTFTSFIYW